MYYSEHICHVVPCTFVRQRQLMPVQCSLNDQFLIFHSYDKILDISLYLCVYCTVYIYVIGKLIIINTEFQNGKIFQEKNRDFTLTETNIFGPSLKFFLYILGTMDHINYVFTVDLSKINLNHHYLTMNSYNGSVNKFDNGVLLKIIEIKYQCLIYTY